MQHVCLVTGGCGFIGSELVRQLLSENDNKVIVVDKMSYAVSPHTVAEFEAHERVSIHRIDLQNREQLTEVFEREDIATVFHLAAESHVDRSIATPAEFVLSNVLATTVLLTCAQQHYLKLPPSKKEQFRFIHVSTDEVYGSLPLEGGETFSEMTAYSPRSPYAASKAGSDHMVRAWMHTYGLPGIVTNCSNNYGPFQYPEKLIPKTILNIMNEAPIPVYGNGVNVRDWIYVGDHADALRAIALKGTVGQSYNVGAGNEWRNIDLVTKLCDLMDARIGRPIGHSRTLIEFVKDRPGHDERYSIDASKISDNLSWKPTVSFEEGLNKTIDWYMNHPNWWDGAEFLE